VTDINECKAIDGGGCSEFAKCINTPGSHKCVCSKGFDGDGFDCQKGASACVALWP